MTRYARQEMIAHWDQDRLTHTSLAVLGTGWLGRLVSLLAVAMGFGRVMLVGNTRVTRADQRFFLADAALDDSVARRWGVGLAQVNPDVDVVGIQAGPGEGAVTRLQDADLVVCATNDLKWQALGYHLGRMGRSRIAAMVGPQVGMYVSGDIMPRRFLAFRNATEDPLLALLMAGLIVEEARRLRMPLGEWDRPRVEPTLVSLDALHRRGEGRLPDAPMPNALRVSLVGAGALGTWAAIGLGLSATETLRLRVFDSDLIEQANLNRQVLFYDAVGKSKALVMAERMRALFPGILAKGHPSRVSEADSDGLCTAVGEANLVLSAPDNFTTRAVLNRAAVSAEVPLVNGGTSAFGADVEAYVPGQSACLSCALQIDRVADLPKPCGHVAEASVVTSNAIAGALMAYEARAVLCGCPTRGVLEYDARMPGRKLGVRSVKAACGCHRTEEALVG